MTACPRCGRTRLFDLRTTSGRANALVALAKRLKGGPSRLEKAAISWGKWIIVVPTLAASFVTYVLTGSGSAAFAAAALAFLGLWALALTCFAVYGLVGLLYAIARFIAMLFGAPGPRDPDCELPRLLLAEPSTVEASQDRFVGRVRLLEPTSSPLARRACAAYRVVGEGPLGPVDDGGGTTFDIVGDGETARVVLGSATLDIPVSSAPVTVRPDDELTRFLEQRGIFPERGPVRLAEGVVEEGDRVEVVGRPRRMVASDGYRGQKELRVFTEGQDVPLLVRKLGGAPSPGPTSVAESDEK